MREQLFRMSRYENRTIAMRLLHTGQPHRKPKLEYIETVMNWLKEEEHA